MDESQDNARKDALAFLKRHNTGVLATVSGGGEVHAAAVFYTADDNFNIYILMLTNTRKYKSLLEHPQVAFVIYTPDVPQTLQVRGVAMDISQDEDSAVKRRELFDTLNSNPWFYAPPAKLDPADAEVVWLKPQWVRWADYAFEESGSAHVFKEIELP